MPTTDTRTRGGFFGNLLGGLPVVGSLLNAAGLTTDLQDDAKRANTAATDIAGQQQQQYSNLYNQGQHTFNTGTSALGELGKNPLLSLFQSGYSTNPLLQQFGQVAGLNLNAPAGNPLGANPVQPGGGFTNGVPNRVRNDGVVSGPSSPVQPPNGVGVGNTPTGQSSGPYGLTQGQQVHLNQTIERINQRAQSHVSQYMQRMSSQGISPNIAQEGAARLQQEYDQMAEGSIADFVENARQSKETALQALISAGAGAYGQQQNFGQQQQNEGTNASLSSTAGLTNPQMAQQQAGQQQMAQNAGNMNGIMQLLGQFLPGGAFAGGGLFGGAGGGGGTPPLLGGMGNTPSVSTGSLPDFSSFF